jgi:hypothetical protein
MANVMVIGGRLVTHIKKLEKQIKEKNFTVINFILAYNHNKEKSSFLFNILW